MKEIEMEVEEFLIRDETSDQQEKPKIKTQIPPWKFVFVIYFCVCGGAYGLEMAVQKGYPAYTLCLLLVVPLFWALPISLITAELGTALPSNQGAFIWIQTAFGPRVAFVTSILYWFSYSVDTSLYPALFYAYFKDINEELFSEIGFQFGIPLITTSVIVVLNILGIDIIGTLSVVLLCIQLIPIFILFIWSAVTGRINPSDWIALPPGEQLSFSNIQQIAMCLQVIVWSYSGYDSVGCIVEELKDSKKNLTRCLLGASVLATFTYFIVIIGSIGIEKDYTLWEEGYLATMAQTLAGPWFKYTIIVAAMIASLGTFNALMFPTSQQLKSLGSPEYLDLPFLTYSHPRFDTPWVAVLINGIVCGLCGSLPFSFLVQLNNILYSILIICVCCSAVRLRFSEKGKKLRRPFKAAEDNGLLVLLVFWPIMICLYLIVDAIVSNWILGVVSAGLVVVLVVLFVMCNFRQNKKRKGGFGELVVNEDMEEDTDDDRSLGMGESFRKNLIEDDDY